MQCAICGVEMSGTAGKTGIFTHMACALERNRSRERAGWTELHEELYQRARESRQEDLDREVRCDCCHELPGYCQRGNL